MSASPSTAAFCPCGGRCHHDTAPCSLGCWAAQNPWRPEEAAAVARRDALAEAAEAVRVYTQTFGVTPLDDLIGVVLTRLEPEP